jgi:Skp family chaperone for outer membrane proteins
LAVAQNYPTSDQFQVIATINQERLFAGSLYGKAFTEQFQKNSKALAKENHRIETELSTEEDDLTQKRKEIPNKEFRKLAAAFNDKVEKIRQEQSQKLKKLNASRIQAQRMFFMKAKPIIVELMRERGILFILNDQAVFISASSGDITDSAIKRIDQVLGAGIPPKQ